MYGTYDRNATADTRPRRAEYWEHMYELFPGATVLDDLEVLGDDEEAARWVVVRYAAVRAAALLLVRDIQAADLRRERNVGLNHLRAVPMLDGEAWALKRLLAAVHLDPTADAATALINAAGAATVRGHRRGAFAMYLLAFRLAERQSWYFEGARAARGIERLALDAGAVHSPRLWRRRARVFERRAAVA